MMLDDLDKSKIYGSVFPEDMKNV